MTKSDHELGMDQSITRRDFLNGVGVAVGSTLLRPAAADGQPGEMPQQAPSGASSDEYYPPLRSGLRGNHPGSFETAHAMRDGRTWETGEDTRETYDLVVVGGGLSGLAAAYFFRKQSMASGVRILVLDNHDDFGGNAKRNEFQVNGRTLIASAGSYYINRPATYPYVARELLKDIGIDFFDRSYKIDRNLYSSLGLEEGTYFDRETFGADRLVKGLASPPTATQLAQTPLSLDVQRDLIRLWTDRRDYLAGVSPADKVKTLQKTSYQDYLIKFVRVQPDLLKYLHPRGLNTLTVDTTSAWWAFSQGYPGFMGLGLAKAPEAPENLDANRPNKDLPVLFSLPDGNAAVARLLVRALIPDALPGKTMADAEMTRLQYAQLDSPSHAVRVRLNSTVVRVRHVGSVDSATEVEVVYVREDRAYTVRSKGCVLACNHAMIPYLAPDLPEAQKAAMHLAVRSIFVFVNVAIRNWKAFKKLGVWNINVPGVSYPGYYTGARLNDAISVGSYRPPRTPDDPIVLTTSGMTVKHGAGLNARDMFRAARATLYQTSFETFERRLREHLARILGDGGFDPAREIAGITVNRWAHGATVGMNLLFDPDWTDDEVPWVVARKPFGRITIANSDAAGTEVAQAAFDQAYRAVDELDRRYSPFPNRV